MCGGYIVGETVSEIVRQEVCTTHETVVVMAGHSRDGG